MKNRILSLAGFTVIVMPIIAVIIDYFSDDLELGPRVFGGPASVWMQIYKGFQLGGFTALGAWFLVNRRFMREIKFSYNELLASLKLNTSEIIFISFCAGFGEEILFRGAIQPLLGIWLTAILFVAIHGYLSLRNWRMLIYGLYMTVVIALIGFSTERYGIWSAVIAHTLIDIVLLWEIKKGQTKRKEEGAYAESSRESGSDAQMENNGEIET